MLVLNRAEVERLLDFDALLEALAGGLRSLSAGEVSAPPRVAAGAPQGLLAVMPCRVPGAGLEVKLVSVFPGNHALDRPSHQALIALFDDATGTPLAIMDGTAITAVRTAAVSALATRVLARPDAAVLAILGAGVQGRSHLAAVTRVRHFTEIRIASRDPAHAAALARSDARAVAAPSFEAAVRGADVVCCCTDSPVPVLRAAWLEPGAHVTSVGCSPAGPELDRETLTAGLLVVEARVAFEPFPAGAPGLAGLDPLAAAELGEILGGARPGRQHADQITVYRSMGHAVEDAAAARLVYERAGREGVGREVDLDGA
jgi:alanine dehydrogenase